MLQEPAELVEELVRKVQLVLLVQEAAQELQVLLGQQE